MRTEPRLQNPSTYQHLKHDDVDLHSSEHQLFDCPMNVRIPGPQHHACSAPQSMPSAVHSLHLPRPLSPDASRHIHAINHTACTGGENQANRNANAATVTTDERRHEAQTRMQADPSTSLAQTHITTLPEELAAAPVALVSMACSRPMSGGTLRKRCTKGGTAAATGVTTYPTHPT